MTELEKVGETATKLADGIPKELARNTQRWAAQEREARRRFRTTEEAEAWEAKTTTKVKGQVDKALAKIKKQIGTAAKKSKVSEKNLVKALIAAEKHSWHPNKVAFDLLFPKERRFDFTALDYGTYPEDAVTPDDLKRYNALAGGLGRIDDALYKLHQLVKKHSNLPLWEDEYDYDGYSTELSEAFLKAL